MTIDDFRSIVHTELTNEFVEETIGWTLYSSINTVKKGKIYVIGLNPGDDPAENKIENSFDKIKHETYNAYLYENWSTSRRKFLVGEHPLQKNLKILAELFGLKVNDVCATNLIFEGSRNQDGIRKVDREKYWNIHKRIIEVIEPKIIITFGNGQGSPYQYLRYSKAQKITYEGDFLYQGKPNCGHGKYRCKSFVGEIENRDTAVIGLPHLSTYSLWTAHENPVKKEVLNWIRQHDTSS